VWTHADTNILRQLIAEAVERRRAKLKAKNSGGGGDASVTEKNVKDMIDAALALNVPEETMISDLLTFFIGGFHTSASGE